MFEICVLTERSENETAKIGCGQSTIGSFREKFEIVFEYWTPAEYKHHWRDSVQRIIDGHNVSCLLTSLTDPQTANFIFCWPLWRVGDFVQIQNRILFLRELSTPFDINRPYLSIDGRETTSTDGSPISEWQTTIAELQAWLAR